MRVYGKACEMTTVLFCMSSVSVRLCLPRQRKDETVSHTTCIHVLELMLAFCRRMDIRLQLESGSKCLHVTQQPAPCIPAKANPHIVYKTGTRAITVLFCSFVLQHHIFENILLCQFHRIVCFTAGKSAWSLIACGKTKKSA